MSDQTPTPAPQEPRELIPLEEAAPAAVAPWDVQPAGLFSTLADPDRAFEALTLADPFMDHINRVMVVTDVIAHPVTVKDAASGEPKPETRTVMVGHNAEGEPVAVASVSAGVRQSIAALALIYGRPPWRPGIMVRLASKKTAAGRTTYYLSAVKSK